MDSPSQEHRAAAPDAIRCAMITVSDTRTVETDTGGRTIVEMLESAGHSTIAREIIPDDPRRMRSLILSLVAQGDVDAILMTGGTGVSSRDRTYETVSDLMSKILPGYGELFRMLSYQDIGCLRSWPIRVTI